MRILSNNLEDYLTKIPEDRQVGFKKLAETIRNNIPKGFTETIIYDMPGWVISLEDYPEGYHCTKDTPLPFLNIASQKNFIALYHMGLYSNPNLLKWFTEEFPKYSSKKLDMGKSCIRFKKTEDIPYELIAELSKKMTPKEWIEMYENTLNKGKV